MDMQQDPQAWRALANQLRIDSVRVSSAAGSGHPTSSLSAAELMAVLVAKHWRYDPSTPDNPNNDHLIFSKGHASPLYYAILRAIGAIDDAELATYRQQGSRLEGHPTPVLPWVDVATGSLGQGLPIGVGIALAAKRLDKLPYRTWVLCGDSEMAEGSMWEAFAQAAYDGLDNLTAIIDVNRLGQTGPTRYEWDLSVYSDRARAFGWQAIEIDGHDVEQVDRAYVQAAATVDRPTVIVARTIKGKGVSSVENKNGAHGKPVEDEDAALAELDAQVALAAQLLDRRLGVVEWLAVLAGLVLDRLHAAALQRARDDRGRPLADRLRLRVGALDLLDVVAVDGDRVPAERREPLDVGVEDPAEHRLARLAEAVDVDDRGQVVEPLPGGVLDRLPHRALGHLAVAAQAPDPVRQAVEPLAGQRDAGGDREPLAERAGGDVGRRDAGRGVALEPRAELAEGQQLLVVDPPGGLEHRVVERRRVALGEDQVVVLAQ
ncbi:MAG TPA: thiamine pyrophosphate-dependent enzyme, partial [Candidatus Limnocylindrales bacterium]